MSDILIRIAHVLCERERRDSCVCQESGRTFPEMKQFIGCNSRLTTAALVLAEVQKSAKDEEAA